MGRVLIIFLIGIASVCDAHMVMAAGSIQVKVLRCEYRVNPSGIDTPNPRLSWQLESSQRDEKQTAYQVLVASSEDKLNADKGDLWDSGTIASDQSVHVVYNGRALSSKLRCFWKVRVWDRNHKVSPWSEPSFWGMALLDPADWQAKWISDDIPRYEDRDGKRTRRYMPSSYMRKEFIVNNKVRRAVVYTSALGLYELYINGRRVGADFFAPGWTEYGKRINYQTYEVTDMIREDGSNVLGATLGDGWYVLMHRQEKVRFLAQLCIEYTDGTQQTVVSDESWKTTPDGPILMSDIYNGESYDARKAMPGWSDPGFDDSSWKPVVTMEPTRAKMQAHPGVPVQRTMEIKPVEMTEPKPGMYVFNMGQNFAGWIRLQVKGNRGTTVVMRFAERLNPDGTIYTANLGTAKCTDTYILKGEGTEEWEPRFTYHGFQYVEVTGYPGKPSTEAITGIVMHSNAPITGSFECSNSTVNKLYSNITWSQRSNYFDVPTDCPQRSERWGWTADAQLFIRTAAYNMDIGAFFTNWLITLNDTQRADGAYLHIAPVGGNVSAGWGDAGIVCPWTMYQVYGDRRIIERHYEGMTRWIEYLRQRSDHYLRPKTGKEGDWLNVNAPTPKDLIATAYFGYSTRLMAEMAEAIGKHDDAKKYQELFHNIGDAFGKAYVLEDGKIQGDTQTAYLMALHFDLLPKSIRQVAANHLVENIRQKNWHLSTGFLGTNLLLPTLTEIGRCDVAYRLLTNETFPSWGYCIRQGATSIWEHWNSWTEEKGFQNPVMNSFNHYAFGSVGQWLFATVAGIDTDGPGFKRIIIHPQPGGGLTYVRAGYKSIHGQIATYWRLEQGPQDSMFSLEVTIPTNTTATVCVPAKDVDSVQEGKVLATKAYGVRFLRVEDGNVVFDVGSGQYHFVSKGRIASPAESRSE